MVEAHVCLLHFQLLDKHFLKSKNCLGNRNWADKYFNPCLQAWLHLYLFHDCWILGRRATQRVDMAYTFSLPQLRCSHKMSRLTLTPGSLLWGICVPYTTDTLKASRQDFPFHVSRDAGLQRLPRQCKWFCWAGWERITLLEKPSKISVGQCRDETPEEKAGSHPKGCPCSPRRAKWQQLHHPYLKLQLF